MPKRKQKHVRPLGATHFRHSKTDPEQWGLLCLLIIIQVDILVRKVEHKSDIDPRCLFMDRPTEVDLVRNNLRVFVGVLHQERELAIAPVFHYQLQVLVQSKSWSLLA